MSWDDELSAAAVDIMAELGEDFGVGAETVQGIFHAAGSIVNLSGEEFVVTDPMLQVLAADAETYGISGGEHGTELYREKTGITYTVRSAVPDGNHYTMLTMRR